MACSPTWCLENQGSFASIHVILPPRTEVNCETDAVVTFSGGVEVTGALQGGFLGALLRYCFGGESFYTTVVKNTHSSMPGDVMMAPADPGGIELHKLQPGEELLLTAGAYVASDATVNITTAVQAQLSNSMLSGTGFFLLRASGEGVVACAAYGSIHKFQLNAGEMRSVDNGHLVAWSSHLPYRIGLANSRGGIMSSIKSGEGLMCHFGPGPGTIYVQSHKQGEAETVIKHGKHKAKVAAQGTLVAFCVAIPVLLILVVVVFSLVMHFSSEFALHMNDSFSKYESDDYSTNRRSRPTTSQRAYRAVGEF
jgi:uncharacterized protein (TIGR00266 family)